MASVLEYLQGRGQVFTVFPRPNATPSADQAHDARVPAGLAARTIVVIAGSGPAVLVLPSSRRLDMELVAEAVGDPDVRLATELELETQFPDHEPGTLPPLAMLLLVPMYVDPAIVQRDEIVFAAGRRDLSIKMATSELFGNDPVVIAPLTIESRVGASS